MMPTGALPDDLTARVAFSIMLAIEVVGCLVLAVVHGVRGRSYWERAGGVAVFTLLASLPSFILYAVIVGGW